MDSGASVSVLSWRLFKKLRNDPNPPKLVQLPPEMSISGAGGSSLEVMGATHVKFEMRGRVFSRQMYVINGLQSAAILGEDFLEDEGVIMDHGKKTISFNSTSKTKFDKRETDWSVANLEVTSQVKIPSMCTKVVELGTRSRSGYRLAPGQEGICESRLGGIEHIVEALQTTNINGKVEVVVMNTSNTEVTLERGQVIGSFTNTKEAAFMAEIEDKTIMSMLGKINQDPPEPDGGAAKMTEEDKKFIRENLNLGCPENFKEKYFRLFEKFHDVVSKSKFDLGRTKVIQHEVKMKDGSEVVHQKQFRIPYAHMKCIQDYVTELLSKGCVIPSKSPFNTAIFCVVKKNGDLRVIQDFRPINMKAVADKYIIRDVRQCLDEIGHAKSKVFTCIDLVSGFWQQSLEEKSRQYTAFTVPGKGRFEWAVSPMGLSGSPSSFARMMDHVMRSLPNTLCYIDDILCHSKDWDSHLEHLEKCLLRLRKYNLKISLKKSTVATTEAEYLGHTLTQHGVKPGRDKLEAVRKFQEPKDAASLRSFVGLVNYFRAHLEGFTYLSGELTKLLRKDSPWKGGNLPPKAKQAFYELRDKLCKEPIIAYPRNDLPFRLAVDAATGKEEEEGKSIGGLGAILTQIHEDKKEYVVSYASRALKKHEKKYTSFLLEMAAAVWAIDYFDVYLKGQKFTLITDHKPVEAVSKTHTKTLHRLQEQMNMYDMSVEYRPGKENGGPDALSRNPVSMINRELIEPVVDTEARKLQKSDQQIQKWYKFIRDGDKSFSKEEAKQLSRETLDMFIEDEAVWRIVRPRGMRARVTLVAPEAVRGRLMKAAHNTSTGGHAGIGATGLRIQANYFWPGMIVDILKMIKECKTCQEARPGANPPVPLRPLEEVDGPNQRIHVDLMGELRSSEGGHKWIMVITDAWSKYVVLVPLKDKSAETAAKAIFERWCCTRSIPRSILSDGGREFVNKLSDELYKLLEIKRLTTSPARPQTNASAERFNRTMIKYLKAILDNNTLDWEPYLAPLMLSYNTQVHKSTLESPFFLTYMHEPNMPHFDFDKPKPLYNESWASERFKILQETYSMVKENNSEARSQQKKYFDKKTKEKKFEVGDKVLVEFNNIPIGINKKFWKNWKGVFTVSKVTSPTNLEVRLTPLTKPIKVNINRVRHFYESRSDFERLQPENQEKVEENLEKSKYENADEQFRRVTRSMARLKQYSEICALKRRSAESASEDESEAGDLDDDEQFYEEYLLWTENSNDSNIFWEENPLQLSEGESSFESASSGDEWLANQNLDPLSALAAYFFAPSERRQTRSSGPATDHPWVMDKAIERK